MLMRFCNIWYPRFLRADDICFTIMYDSTSASSCMRNSSSGICINKPACWAKGLDTIVKSESD